MGIELINDFLNSVVGRGLLSPEDKREAAEIGTGIWKKAQEKCEGKEFAILDYYTNTGKGDMFVYMGEEAKKYALMFNRTADLVIHIGGFLKVSIEGERRIVDTFADFYFFTPISVFKERDVYIGVRPTNLSELSELLETRDPVLRTSILENLTEGRKEKRLVEQHYPDKVELSNLLVTLSSAVLRP